MAKIKIRKKEYQEKDVFDAALDRIRYIYQRFDKVVVSFSGGKDSTVVLQMTMIVAKELDRLPLDVVFFDEEVISPETVEYCERISQDPDINFSWFCLPCKLRNAASNVQPYWHPWNPEKKDVWVRPLPETAITEHPRFNNEMGFQHFCPYIYEKKDGAIAMLTGIRTQESMRRYQSIARKKNDAYITGNGENNQYRCSPIYDWSSEDVWLVVKKLKWDYNTTYDIYNKTNMHGRYLAQRVGAAFGEEPLRRLWIYSECWPELWEKMTKRVPGILTAWRYANSELYSNATKKPENLSYKEYLNVILETFSTEPRQQVKKTLNGYMRRHKKFSKMPIPDNIPDPISGVSWQFLCRCAIRGDFKARQLNVLPALAEKTQKKLGITLDEAKKLYGHGYE